MKTIIALTGNKGSGKSTAFNFIKELLPNTVEITLADKLKRASAEVFNIPRSYFDNPAVKEKELEMPVVFNAENTEALIRFFKLEPNYDKHIRPHIGKILHTPRQIAQYVGTEVLRNVSEDVHCLGAVQDLPENGLFGVTDLRFWNEFFFFFNLPNVKFLPLFIHNTKAEAKAALDTHVSEKYVLDIAKKCLKVDNNGSMQDLKIQLEAILKEIV